MRTIQHFVGGKSYSGNSNRFGKVFNTATGEQSAKETLASTEDVNLAITNAKKSLDAGCNLALYCSGNINDNLKLIKSLPYIDNFTSKKTSEFYKFLR